MTINMQNYRNWFCFVAADSVGDGLPVIEHKRAWRKFTYRSAAGKRQRLAIDEWFELKYR